MCTIAMKTKSTREENIVEMILPLTAKLYAVVEVGGAMTVCHIALMSLLLKEIGKFSCGTACATDVTYTIYL